MSTPAHPYELEKHREFLRSLAKHLVRNEADAEDLVQQALVVAIERPPGMGGALGAWLGTILRNLSRNHRRAGTRRSDHESSVAPREGEADPVDALAMLEVQHLVLDAVADLEEPVRAVVSARFYEGLSCQEIAKRRGGTARGVESAVARGIEQLRQNLRKRCGGDYTRWMPALVRLAKAESAPGPSSLELATRLAGGVAVLIVAGTVAVHVARELRSNGAISVLPEMEAATNRGALSTSVGARTELPAQPTPDRTGSLRLMAHWEDGSPMVDMGVQVDRIDSIWTPTFQRALTDKQGVTVLSRLLPGEVRITLDRGESRVATILAGHQSEVLLDVAAGVTVAGIVSDRQGNPVADAVVVLIEAREGWPLTHRLATTDSGGRYQVRSVPPGSLVSAIAAGFAPAVPKEMTDNPSAGSVQVDLRLASSGSSLRGIALDANGRPVAGALVMAGTLQQLLCLEDSKEYKWIANPMIAGESDQLGRFEIHGILGSFATPILVRASGYAACYTTYPGEPGRCSFVQVVLKEAGTIQGVVRDQEGRPIEGARVQVRPQSGDSQLNQLLVLDGVADQSGHYALGVPQEDIEIVVRPPEGSMAGAQVVQSRVVGVTTQDVVLPPDRAVRGRLLAPDGEPQRGVELQFACRGEVPTVVRTEPDGRFTIPDCATPPCSLGIREVKHRDPFKLDDAVCPALNEQTWTVGRKGRIFGSFLDSGEQLPAGVLPEALLTQRGGRSFLGEWDGERFIFEDVTPADYRLQIRGNGKPGIVPYRSEWLTLHDGESLDCGTVSTEPSGSLRVDLGGVRAVLRCVLRSLEGEVSAYLTVEEGTAVAESVAAGEWLLDVSTPGMARDITRTLIRPGETTLRSLSLVPGVDRTLHFPLAPGHDWQRLRIRVVDQEGRLRAADVVQENHRSRQVGLLVCLPVGTYQVFADLDDEFHIEGTFDVVSLDPQSAPLEFPLR